MKFDVTIQVDAVNADPWNPHFGGYVEMPEPRNYALIPVPKTGPFPNLGDRVVITAEVIGKPRLAYDGEDRRKGQDPNYSGAERRFDARIHQLERIVDQVQGPISMAGEA